jgi:hypothetical protein
MNKDEILKMSREENKGRQDEREMMVYGVASKVGMSVGAIVCVLLVWASEFLFNVPEVGLAGWFVYFAMGGSSNVVLYKNLKKRQYLIWGIVEIIFSVLFAAALVIKGTVIA